MFDRGGGWVQDRYVNDRPNSIAHGLGEIRHNIEKLHLPAAAYAGIAVNGGTYTVALVAGDTATTIKVAAEDEGYQDDVVDWLHSYAAENNVKVVAATLLDGAAAEEIGSKFWLQEDVVPHVINKVEAMREEDVRHAAHHTCNAFDKNNLVNVRVLPGNEVDVSFLTVLDEYQDMADGKSWERLQAEAEAFRSAGERLLFINATPQGGGVALMRHALLRLLRLLEVDAHWHVMQPSQEVFEITKSKFHNVLQAVAPEDEKLTQHDKQVYEAWIRENVDILRDAIKAATVIVIDDPQPSGLVPHIKHINSEALIVYRSHIHLEKDLLVKKGSPQKLTWDFLSPNIKAADLFVAHPVKAFVPDDVHSKTVSMPATTDPLDGLNKGLALDQMAYYQSLFNKILFEHDQDPINPSRPYIIQVARFDPSKGIPDVIEAFRLLRERMAAEGKQLPQLVLTGHGSVDDPDGVPVYNMIINLLKDEKYRDVSDDVKVVRLHHNDQILNAMLRGSRVAVQLSYKEGFEVKVSEALHKGKPVVAYASGGIPLQIEDGVTGYLVPTGEVEMVADALYKLMTDDGLYEKMSVAAENEVRKGYFTAENALRWLFLANEMRASKKLPGEGALVDTMIEDRR